MANRKRRTIGRCALCLDEKELIRSHIIPKFHWKRLKEKEGFFHILSIDPAKGEKREQREITENLLCSKCDTVILQKNEEHLARVLYGGRRIVFKNEGRFLHLSGFDYVKVKNALLSILWRMSHSSHPYFEEIELGHKHTERIRRIVLNAEKVSESEYPILLTVPLLGGKHYGDWLLPPDFIRCEGNRVYRCLISGFLFGFPVGSAGIPNEWGKLNLKAEGSWCVIMAQVSEIPFLADLCSKLGSAQQKRGRKT